MSNRMIVALDGGNGQQREAITIHLNAREWQVWHWFQDLWLLANVPDVVTPNRLFQDLYALPPVHGSRLLVTSVADDPSYFGSADGRSWPWMATNWGAADVPRTPGQPLPAASIVPKAVAAG